jgi:ADP-ribose pyrophosphatase
LPSFRKLGETEVLRVAHLQVVSGQFEGPGGERFERSIVRHPGAVVVVPLTANGTVIMVRQFRPAVDAELLEIPAGKRDVTDEPTDVTAARELAEEIGQQAGHLDLLARFYNSPGFTDELTWVYLARDLSAVPLDRQGPEEQHMRTEEVALTAVAGLVRSGQILDAKSIIGLTLARAAVAAEDRPGEGWASLR